MKSMQKISPAYREDQYEPLEPALREYIDANYLLRQPNIEKVNRQKVMILFAGGSAVGKSSLSKALQGAFDGVVLENDGIKRVLQGYTPPIELGRLSPVTWNYTVELYGRLDELTKNGFIIRDGMIHWYFDRLLPVIHDAGYRTIIIHYALSKQKNEELIRRRGDTPTTTAQRLTELLDDHEVHMARFLARHRPDITIDEANLYDYERVIGLVTQLLDDK